jgi:hypothetical protein
MRFVDGAASLSEKFGCARAAIGRRRVFDAGRRQRSGAGRYRRQGLFVIVGYCLLLFVDELWCDFGLVGANAVDVAASRQQCAFFGRDASKVFVAWNTTSSRVHDNNNHNNIVVLSCGFEHRYLAEQEAVATCCGVLNHFKVYDPGTRSLNRFECRLFLLMLTIVCHKYSVLIKAYGYAGPSFNFEFVHDLLAALDNIVNVGAVVSLLSLSLSLSLSVVLVETHIQP